jgi:hypothetical protein
MLMDLKGQLSRLESRLQILIEGSAALLFSGRQTSHDLAFHLVEALRNAIRVAPDGEAIAPDVFTLLAHPDHCRVLQADPAVLDELAHSLRQAGQEAGLHFLSPPVVRLASSPELNLGEIRVTTQASQADLPETDALKLERSQSLEAIPENAFLIVDGTQIFPLTQMVVNIGRRPDNQLVIDDPRISRLHAQLRASQGRYMIFDLDSLGGTWVNGARVHQCALYSGDVISLSGVPLVFGQDMNEQSRTQEYSPTPGK